MWPSGWHRSGDKGEGAAANAPGVVCGGGGTGPARPGCGQGIFIRREFLLFKEFPCLRDVFDTEVSKH